MGEWRADILGEGFECRDLPLDAGRDPEPGAPVTPGGGAEHALVATLVRALPSRPSFRDRLFGRTRACEGIDVLYVHGWSDYFFQRSLARYWTDRGARFFALDLRRYGRSLRNGQTPGYVENLIDYDEEIDLAVREIRASAGSSAGSGSGGTGGPRRLVLLGHSTGGLVLSLWSGRHPDGADALILNSPWLEFQLAARGRQLIAPLVSFGARWNPKEAAPQLDYGFYTRAQQEVGPAEDLDGVNLEWRPERTHTVHSGWLNAILTGQAQVAAGLGITAPICVLLSARSVLPTRWGKEL
ncbi:MAG: alpha/beta fold hydrolase, partial [Actinobacteria bacterium]|nr:alpha/beta fold hydrolase [Actinomycetota bacterium]